MKKHLFLIFFLFQVSFSYSQEKLEREYRIKEAEVPALALQYVKSNFEGVRMKWYGEENLDGKAIEAKGKRDGKLYSVKFSTDGKLQDIEMVVRFNTIPENVKNAIEKNLEKRFSKFRIQKTQIQWVGEAEVLAELIKGTKISGSYVTNYEITLQGTIDRRTDYYEVLANYTGDLVRESKIVQRNKQNLIY